MIWKILSLMHFFLLTFFMSISVDCKRLMDSDKLKIHIIHKKPTREAFLIFWVLFQKFHHTIHTHYSMTMFVY